MAEGRTILGIIAIFIVLIGVGAVIGFSVWVYRNRVDYSPTSGGGTCNNGNIVVPKGTTTGNPPQPVSPPDGVSCYTLEDYNVYPTARVSKPDISGSVSFGPTQVDGGPACYQKCDATEGCKMVECVDNGSGCTCTGYTVIPEALVSDMSHTQCLNDNKCTTVYVRSNAI